MRGEKGSETAYSEDPVSVATDWVSLGAEQLHVVDLDAAFGEPSQRDVIAAIVRSVDVPVQVGGGVRSLDDFRELLALGVGTVVFGTAAVEAPEVVEHAIDLAREKVVLAVDVKDARVAVRGWTETSSEEPVNFGLRWQGRGVTTFVYTDTARDGAMVGPNIDATLSFAERTGAAVNRLWRYRNSRPRARARQEWNGRRRHSRKGALRRSVHVERRARRRSTVGYAR